LNYKLYKEFAKFYKFHTPDTHYMAGVNYINYLIKKNNITNILDVGCGNGATSYMIYKKYKNVRIDGFDISEDMIKEAKERNIDVNFFVDDMSKFEKVPSKSYDLILLMSWVINYSSDKNILLNTLNNIYNHLKNKGMCIIETPHIPNILEYVFKDVEYSYIDKYHIKKQSDIYFFFGFEAINDLQMKAKYNFIYQSKNIILYEEHLLNFCNAFYIANLLKDIGFSHIFVMDSYREKELNGSYRAVIKAIK
jgi:SAM-dependent methyltransferase